MRKYICLRDRTTGKIIRSGDVVKTFRGEEYILEGGTPPHHEASTGRVWVRSPSKVTVEEYFPSVINAKWSEN